MTKLVHVAVGVIVSADGNILIARRPQAAHQGGLWEFPGGKVDAGEAVHQALVRELQEELAIHVTESKPLIQIRHNYPDKSVLLDVYKVTGFEGEPHGAEGQPTCWVAPANLNNFEFPAANRPIITAISLPEKYLVTGAFIDEEDFCIRLDNAYKRGIRIVQLRLPDIESLGKTLLGSVISLSEKYSATLLINTCADLFAQIRSDFPFAKLGLHLNSSNAKAVSVRPVASDCLLGMSCHNESEIAHARQLDVDYLLLSPVMQTKSHPNAEPLGWANFESLVKLANVPVYALGGVDEDDLDQAKAVGAQGVAGISAWW